MLWNKRRKFRKALFLCVFLSLFLAGCTLNKETEQHTLKNHQKELEKEAIPPSFHEQEIMLPIQTENGQFNSVSGWLNNEEIVYITNVGLGSHVYTYNIFTGKNQLIFESESPVASVIVSPSGKRLLVHTAPTSFEGIITIIDQNGKEIMSERMEAFDFAFEWNPYDEDQLLLSSFTESWDFSSYQMNLKDKKLIPMQLKEPFAGWKSKDELVYLDWGQEEALLFAPLKQRSIFSEQDKTILDKIYYMKAIKSLIMTITVPSDKINESAYTFLSSDLNKLAVLNIPHLTRFSDWLIPYFDFDERDHFYTFAPLYSSEADTYAEGFQLLSLNIKDGEKTVVFENLENEPLSCSPNGSHCLYGFYFEKLINMDSKEIMPIIKE
ncbi:hypothetical protein ACTHO0_20655 [Cytobacillus praedii]|uniref:YqgU-like beta propeller domain-containing protein n=1 Tax=Cytobacillus praedii TaxID=1742358 RepID=UPI003AF900C3